MLIATLCPARHRTDRDLRDVAAQIKGGHHQLFPVNISATGSLAAQPCHLPRQLQRRIQRRRKTGPASAACPHCSHEHVGSGVANNRESHGELPHRSRQRQLGQLFVVIILTGEQSLRQSLHDHHGQSRQQHVVQLHAGKFPLGHPAPLHALPHVARALGKLRRGPGKGVEQPDDALVTGKGRLAQGVVVRVGLGDDLVRIGHGLAVVLGIPVHLPARRAPQLFHLFVVGPCPDGRGDSTVRRGDGQHAQVRHVLPGIDLAVTDQRHAPPRLELHGLAGQVIVDIAEAALHVGAGREHLTHQAHAPCTELGQPARDVDQPHIANGREDSRQLHEGRIQVHGQRIVDQVLAGLFSPLI